MGATAVDVISQELGDEEPQWAVRCDLAACCQLVDLYGMSDFPGTHITARVPGTSDHFFMTPPGIHFGEMTASVLVEVGPDGKAVGEGMPPINYAGFVIHSAVYAVRPDVVSVVHTHTEAVNAVGMLREGLLPITQKALLLWDALRYHRFEGAALDLDERQALGEDLNDGWCMILKHHGSLTVGRTVGDAFSWTLGLEVACKHQVAGLTGGRELEWLEPEVVARTIEQGRRFRAARVAREGHGLEWFSHMGDLTWPAYLRKLERERGGGWRQ
jgi:ribulose-5-phosphate 4-epimerase/fuculose-1-phosphate aldolase